eukprot:1395107-Amphidinium_carterae.1
MILLHGLNFPQVTLGLSGVVHQKAVEPCQLLRCDEIHAPKRLSGVLSALKNTSHNKPSAPCAADVVFFANSSAHLAGGYDGHDRGCHPSSGPHQKIRMLSASERRAFAIQT